MINFEFKLFPKFFGNYWKRTDINKTIDNTLPEVDPKGTNERFNEAIGKDMDTGITPFISNLTKNTYDIDNVLSKFIEYREAMFGYSKDYNTLYIAKDLPTRRKVLSRIKRIIEIKGTLKAYHILFGWLGLDAEIIESFNEYGFDSPYTFDDPFRRFDMQCATCSKYSILLTDHGSNPPILDLPTLIDAIESIRIFNEPINADLLLVRYNGDALYAVVQYTIADNGTLVYNNPLDPDLVLSLNDVGELIIGGPDVAKYRLNIVGDLLYTI